MSAALRLSAQVKNATIVAIICDRADRYLSTGEGLLPACGVPASGAPSSACQHELDPDAAPDMRCFCRISVPFAKPLPIAAAFHPCHSMPASCNCVLQACTLPRLESQTHSPATWMTGAQASHVWWPTPGRTLCSSPPTGIPRLGAPGALTAPDAWSLCGSKYRLPAAPCWR